MDASVLTPPRYIAIQTTASIASTTGWAAIAPSSPNSLFSMMTPGMKRMRFLIRVITSELTAFPRAWKYEVIAMKAMLFHCVVHT